jgi:hypothetical protein
MKPTPAMKTALAENFISKCDNSVIVQEAVFEVLK